MKKDSVSVGIRGGCPDLRTMTLVCLHDENGGVSE